MDNIFLKTEEDRKRLKSEKLNFSLKPEDIEFLLIDQKRERERARSYDLPKWYPVED